MTSDKRLPVDSEIRETLQKHLRRLKDRQRVKPFTKSQGMHHALLVLILQITRPAGDVAENATTAKGANSLQLENLSNSTPLPEHFQSFHDAPENHLCISGIKKRLKSYRVNFRTGEFSGVLETGETD